jgi:hypothetical protein
MLAWQIRGFKKLMAEVDTLLTGGEKLDHPSSTSRQTKERREDQLGRL